MDLKKDVIAYLEQSRPVPGESEEEKLACHYLDVGVIDSMGIVRLIADMEEKHGFQFTEDDLQSFEFQTVGGLISIIEKRIHDGQV